ncbi:MAG: hypothetical protein Pg6C_00740 [Treponemataceae bacterium]|nr:MAG: hypothetical protein Pg6C_00740 [Treponemataceae bacterium]
MKQALTVFFRYIEPVFVFALFAAVPIAQSGANTAFAFPSLSQGAFMGISGIWLWMSYRFFTPPRSASCPLYSVPRSLLSAFAVFAFLCASGIFFFTLSGSRIRFNAADPSPLLIAVIAAAAFFEEILYRAYLPAKARVLLPRPRFFLQRKQMTRVVPEIFCVILFSAAHLRGGVFSALNAFFAGAALQICFAKTNSVVLTGSVHAAYNITALAWLLWHNGAGRSS